MDIEQIMSPEEITVLAKERFLEERGINRLEGWFLAREIMRNGDEKYKMETDAKRTARTLVDVAEKLPLSLGDYHLFAGTQDDAFARSYALINPAFTVDSFSGYCDPVAVFKDIEPSEEVSRERIEALRDYNAKSLFADALRDAYGLAGDSTSEAVFFIEQVTGHLIPDVRPMLLKGVEEIRKEMREAAAGATVNRQKEYFEAMETALEAVLVLAKRYAKLAEEKKKNSEGTDKKRYELMEKTLQRVPRYGARNLYEAIQAFILIWQTMCLEQTPNPFAFSVGNADRIFESFRAMEDTRRDEAAALFKHLLVFFNVADRSWAISQNLIVGGKNTKGQDLTSLMSYAILDAYYDMNLPQPILSVKLHRNTPDKLYESLGRFFFTPGCLTPSLFNDDALFKVLKQKNGVREKDLPDYAVAGCQEPLIMGKDNGNTTNSWLNLGKILELSLNGGMSMITGKKLGICDEGQEYGRAEELLSNIRSVFYHNLDRYIDQMTAAANKASEAVGMLKVPFLSSMMGGAESGIDARDTKEQGTRYNGSGCLIHGLSVVADSFVAIDTLLKERPQDAARMIETLRNDFIGDDEMRQYLLSAGKFGNHIEAADREAALIAGKVADMVSLKKNYLGNPFRPDFATPSTHLLYGFWVGATPDGRKAREQLGYGVDPLYGEAQEGLGFRMLSNMKLPFEKMNGGYASHLGIDPHYFTMSTYEEKGIEFKKKVIIPLFYNDNNPNLAPFYLYVNVTTPEMLKKVLKQPKKYAPSGVYIMRIHGTFVNFLDLSPAIQDDIIKRLDLRSTAM